jgi:CRP/FNR family cyclic AMP-dependent transcriptional regulator
MSSRGGPVRTYNKGDVIFAENSQGSEMYILRSGQVKLTIGSEEGTAEVGILETPGDFFGEMALVDASPRSATAVAEADHTQIEVLDQTALMGILKESPQFALDLMRELSRRVRMGNILYLEVVKGTMSPFCRRNCLRKTMDAFTRSAMGRLGATQESCETKEAGLNWRCGACSYVYVPAFGDPSAGVTAGTSFEELSDDWACPECGLPKAQFEKIEC